MLLIINLSLLSSLLGASLDRRSGKLIESKPKILYEQMPVIYIYAINTTGEDKDENYHLIKFINFILLLNFSWKRSKTL
jgi:hypothetical protein